MKRLSRDEIRAKFEKAAHSEGDTPFMYAVTQLSAAMHELQAAGLDVELTILGVSAEQAFQLDIGNNVRDWRQRSSGILRIGSSEHLVAFCTGIRLKSEGDEAEWKSCVIMAVSQLDIRFQGNSNNLRTLTYNLGEGGDDLVKFQNMVIARCAFHATIDNADKHSSLGKSRAINIGLRSGGTITVPKLPIAKKQSPGK